MDKKDIDIEDALWGTGENTKTRDKYSWQDGLPRVIDITNTEGLSSYQQLQMIAKKTLSPFIEIQKKTKSIVCIVLYGSTVAEPKKPSDIDFLVLTRGDSDLEMADIDRKALSSEAQKVFDELSVRASNNLKYKINGDSITVNHEVEVNVRPAEGFLQMLNLPEGIKKESILQSSRRAMRERSPQKAHYYENLDLTYSDTVTRLGGQIIFGSNIKLQNGEQVFKLRDDELLK